MMEPDGNRWIDPATRHLPESERRIANPDNVILDEFHGKKDIYGPRVGGGKANDNDAPVAVAEAPASVAAGNAQADLNEEKTVRRISTDPQDVAETEEFERTLSDLSSLRDKQMHGTESEKRVAEVAMRELARAEYARGKPRNAITKRLAKYGISKE